MNERRIFICADCGCATFATSKDEATSNLKKYSRDAKVAMSCSHSSIRLQKPFLKQEDDK